MDGKNIDLTSKMVPMFIPYIPKNLNIDIPLQDNNIIYGKYGRFFESALRKFVNNDLLLTINNFNIAYFILLSSLGINKGDEVLVSPLACLESIQPLKAYGLSIKWIDVNIKTGLVDIIEVIKNITKETKLVVLNHYLGNVANIHDFIDLAKKFNIKLINDCNESFASKYNDIILGDKSLPSNYIFNFSAVRNPNTILGAAIIFENDKTFHKGEILRDNGIDRSSFRKSDGEINPNSDVYSVGYSGLMSEVNSYIGYIQMHNMKQILAKQKRLARKWKSVFNKFFNEVLYDIYEDNIQSNYWIYGFHTSDIELTKSKLKKIGFMSSQVHINTAIYSIFNNNKDLPSIDHFLKSFLAVPTGWWVDETLLEENRISRILR